MKDIEYKLLGNKGKSIIFINGFRMPFSSWNPVVSALGDEHTILLYNRYGIEKSKKPSEAQTPDIVIRDLENLITTLEIAPPYVLVGHSLGGIYADLLARSKNKDICAVVLVDATHISEIKEQAKYTPPFLNLINNVTRRLSTLFERYKFSELDCMENIESYYENLEDFPNVPLTVISGAKKLPFTSPKGHEVHQSFQRKLLALSPESKQITLENSHHFPQLSEPNVVAKNIIDIIKVVDKKKPI